MRYAFLEDEQQMKQPKSQPERQQPEPAAGPQVEAIPPTSSSPPANPANPGEEIALTPAMSRLLQLHEEMEREKETAVRQILGEKTRLTEAYQAQIAKLDSLLMKIAPEMIAPPAPSVAAPVHLLPQRTRARAEALAVAAGRTETSAKWNAQKFCPYCQIQGHDGRAHRGQPAPTKWTKAELAAFGYLPPANAPQLPPNYDQIPQVKGQRNY
jgi:hypothetical protein